MRENQEKQPLFSVKDAIWIGVYGGLFWGILAELAWYFNFMNVNPNGVLKYVNASLFKNELIKIIGGILFYMMTSIIFAMLYFALFRKSKTIWTGVLFGIVLWAILFMIAHPLFPNIPSWRKMNPDTLSTTLSLFLLFGLFIGYSISYGYDQKQRMNLPPHESQ